MMHLLSQKMVSPSPFSLIIIIILTTHRLYHVKSNIVSIRHDNNNWLEIEIWWWLLGLLRVSFNIYCCLGLGLGFNICFLLFISLSFTVCFCFSLFFNLKICIFFFLLASKCFFLGMRFLELWIKKYNGTCNGMY